MPSGPWARREAISRSARRAMSLRAARAPPPRPAATSAGISMTGRRAVARSIARDGRIHLDAPAVDPAGEVAHAREPGLPEQRRGRRAAHSVVAVDDDLALALE